MLKFEGIPLGYTIRAYDIKPMHGRGDCYVEGVIVDIYAAVKFPNDYAHYVVDVTKEVFDGVNEKIGSTGRRVRVPMETSHDYDNRITILEGIRL